MGNRSPDVDSTRVEGGEAREQRLEWLGERCGGIEPRFLEENGPNAADREGERDVEDTEEVGKALEDDEVDDVHGVRDDEQRQPVP